MSPSELRAPDGADNGWVEEHVVVPNPQGFHMRPANVVLELAQQFQSEIVLRHKKSDVNAKSMVHMMTVAAKKGTPFVVRARGDDAEAAVAAVADLFRDGFGEMNPTDAEPPAGNE